MRASSRMDGSADSSNGCLPAKASRTSSSSSSPRARSRSSATALSTLTKRLSMRTPVSTRSTGLGGAVTSDLMALPLLVLLFKLGIGDGRRTPKGFERRPEVVFEDALDGGKDVRSLVVGLAALLAVCQVGRLGQAGVDAFEQIRGGRDAARGDAEGDLREGNRPG